VTLEPLGKNASFWIKDVCTRGVAPGIIKLATHVAGRGAVPMLLQAAAEQLGVRDGERAGGNRINLPPLLDWWFSLVRRCNSA
jgi:hypothetical protein